MPRASEGLKYLFRNGGEAIRTAFYLIRNDDVGKIVCLELSNNRISNNRLAKDGEESRIGR